MLPNNQCITEKQKRGNKKYLETNKSKSTIIQNLWATPIVILRGKFIEIQTYLQKRNFEQPKLITKGVRKKKKNRSQS